MRTDNSFLKIVLMLGLLGILVSGWLLSIHVRITTGQAGLTESCSIIPIPGVTGQGCAAIAVSDYSDVFGIPLAAIAMGYYFTQLLLVFWSMRNYQSSYEPLYVAFFLSTLAIVVTVIMFSISRFIVRSFCPGCAILWAVNLALWPCLVKHLGLRWGDALAANLELVRSKTLNLRRQRVLNSFGVGGMVLAVFSVVGTAAASLDRPQNAPGSPAFLEEFGNAPQVFLPPEAYGGPQSKGEAREAPVLDIVEFSDFQCPACRMAAQLLRPLILKHKEKIRFSYRHFPLDGACNPHAPNGRHAFACAAARTGICAAAQDKFWPFHDLIFDHQDELSGAKIESLAQEAGLDMEKLAVCLKDPTTETQLQKEMQWGELVGLESTPTLILNGRRISGARPPGDLEALLDRLERERKR